MKTIQNLAIFGASGQTGLCVLQEVLDAGLSAKVLQRDPETLPQEFRNHSKVEIIVGNVTDAAAVESAVQGADGVIITLGTRNKLDATTELSTGVANIVAAMRKYNIRPISICLSSFMFMPDDGVPAIFREINAEHKRMLEAVANSKDIDWVAILPPHIADNPRGEFCVAHDRLPGGRVVSKRDLAAFLLQALSQPQHFGKRVGISSGVASASQAN